MCLAIYKPKKQSFNLEDVRLAWSNNPHGAGIAVRGPDGKILISKGFMKLAMLEDWLEKNVHHLVGREAVLHLRWATSGNTDEGMTHPFPVSSKNTELKAMGLITDAVVIHNGVLFSPTMGGKYSDTAIFTKWLKVCKPSKARIKEVVGVDRVVIMNKSGTTFYGEWNERHGCKYSNLYSVMPDHFSSGYYSSWYDSDLNVGSWADECPLCESSEVESIGVYTKTMECLSCATVYNELEWLKATHVPKRLRVGRYQDDGPDYELDKYFPGNDIPEDHYQEGFAQPRKIHYKKNA